MMNKDDFIILSPVYNFLKIRTDFQEIWEGFILVPATINNILRMVLKTYDSCDPF